MERDIKWLVKGAIKHFERDDFLKDSFVIDLVHYKALED